MNLKKTLSIARDPFGEKPLYYGSLDSDFIFGSQISSIRHHPSFSHTLSTSSLSQYLRFGYIPDPFSIYENINKLEPSQYGVFSVSSGSLSIHQYASQLNTDFLASPTTLTESKSIFKSLFTHSVKQRMISDVPIGAFLSGGIDSSLVAATMQSISHNPINTYCIGFDDENFNEAPTARSIS